MLAGISLHFFVFIGPPPIPAEPVVTPEPSYVSKVHYGRRALKSSLLRG